MLTRTLVFAFLLALTPFAHAEPTPAGPTLPEETRPEASFSNNGFRCVADAPR